MNPSTKPSSGGIMARQENPIITDPPAATASAKSLFDRVAGYLDANDWN
jgi:hypothetical protein